MFFPAWFVSPARNGKICLLMWTTISSESPLYCPSYNQTQFQENSHEGFTRSHLLNVLKGPRPKQTVAKAEKLSDSHQFAMIQVKNEAQTKVLIAVALSKVGKTADAIATAEAAVPQLARVQSDESMLAAIRDDAARSLRDAQGLLDYLKPIQ